MNRLTNTEVVELIYAQGILLPALFSALMPLLHLSVSFSIWIPSLSVLSRFLSLSLWLTLYYFSLSNMSADTCPLLSASVYFHPLCLPTFPFFSLVIPLSWSVSPFLPLCSNFSLSVTLPELFTRARAHTRIPSRTGIQSQTGIPWLRLAGLFELCSTALRDCVRLCV